jgi:ferredoxin--NADP+ reductase
MTSESAASHDPVLPDAKVNAVPVKEPVIGRVVSNDSCMKGKSNSFVRHTAIDISGTPLAGNFLSGQSFGVIPPGVDEDGKPHKVRLYSIACPTWGEDGKAQVFSTTPKRVIEEYKPQKPGDDPKRHDLFLGVCSNYLCNLQPGDEVKVTGPNGKRFILPVDPDAHDYLFIATGTGIAPFRGFALELLQRPGGGSTKSKIHLMMGSPYTTDLLYDDLFRRLAKEHPNFKYWTAVSREQRPGGGRGIYVDQIIGENLNELRDFLSSPRTLIYVCGLLGMQFGIYRQLANAGLTDGYMMLGDELKGLEPAKWTEEQMRRHIKATRRCMLEVY